MEYPFKLGIELICYICFSNDPIMTFIVEPIMGYLSYSEKLLLWLKLMDGACTKISTSTLANRIYIPQIACFLSRGKIELLILKFFYKGIVSSLFKVGEVKQTF